MKDLTKDILIIVVLAVMAISGIYVANAAPIENLTLLSSDTQSGHYPCSIPKTSRDLCQSENLNCRAWAIYDACVDGSVFCD